MHIRRLFSGLRVDGGGSFDVTPGGIVDGCLNAWCGSTSFGEARGGGFPGFPRVMCVWAPWLGASLLDYAMTCLNASSLDISERDVGIVAAAAFWDTGTSLPENMHSLLAVVAALAC